MPYRSWSERQAKPRTYVGQWLRAAFLRQRELRKELQFALNRGKAGWNDDEPAVVEIAFQKVLRRFLSDSCDAKHITKLVDVLRTATEGDPPVDQLQAEALIRETLGGSAPEVADISPGQKFLLRFMLAGTAAFILELDETAVDELIVDSERIAFERGWKPPIARDNKASRQ